MEIYVGLVISFCLLIFSVLNNIFIGYMLIACWLLFTLIALKRGYTLKDIGRMSYGGGRQSFVVLKILVLIGAVIGIWMASGTIPAIVYYCLRYIIPVMPHIFALAVFLICCLTSLMIGTSFGTVSIVGIPLMIIARSGGVNLNIVAGAVIAGAYFGDRCSPMSSSAILVANLTKTNLFTNIRNMLYSSAVPFLLSLAFYYALSAVHPLKAISGNLPGELLKTFNIQAILLLPAILVLILSLCKVRIEISILIGILSASVLGMLIQNHQLKQVIDYLIFGFSLHGPSPLQGIISGGGIVSMLKTCVVVFVSCSLAGIFTGMKMFDNLQAALLGMRLTGHKLYGATSLVSIVTAAFGCNQTIAVVMTREIMQDCYDRLDSHQLALDLENTGIIICALIPWNIAALVPTTTMGVSAAGYIPYAFYLYILPVTYFIYTKYSSRAEHRRVDRG
ncbi:MAG: Na+/H+ antiporter NhaC family protein [Thermacetogeniaceae bacterium]